jgi:hypothetical protein
VIEIVIAAVVAGLAGGVVLGRYLATDGRFLEPERTTSLGARFEDPLEPHAVAGQAEGEDRGRGGSRDPERPRRLGRHVVAHGSNLENPDLLGSGRAKYEERVPRDADPGGEEV